VVTRFAVEAVDIVLEIIRDALPGVNVRASIPDGVLDFLPLVVVRRIGGSSPYPDFWDDPLINVQNWAAPAGSVDAFRAASDLADQIREALWTAWRTQTVTAGGSIARIRESQGPLEMPDVDLPFLGRFQATYELKLRSPHPV
jgi:hypothetical protein